MSAAKAPNALKRLSLGWIGLALLGGAIACGSSEPSGPPADTPNNAAGGKDEKASVDTNQSGGPDKKTDELAPNPSGTPYVAFATEGAVHPEKANKNTADVDLSSLGDRAQVESTALQDDGKLLIGASLGQYKALPIVVRLTKSGELDETFGDGGVAYVPNDSNMSVSALAIQPDGKILAGCYGRPETGAVVTRFDAKGQPDKTFGSNGKAMIRGLATGVGFITDALRILVGEDGKILVLTGTDTEEADEKSKHDVRAARLASDGKLDATFGEKGISTPFSKWPATDTMESAAILPSGMIVIGGYRTVDSTTGTGTGVLKDNELDLAFGVKGVVAEALH